MKKLAEKVNFIHVFILTFSAIAMLTITQSGNSYEALNCSGTLVTVSCHDAPSWSEDPSGGVFYGRVCDNVKCARAWMPSSDGPGTCTYCNEAVD
jgi:hypothetical protein